VLEYLLCVVEWELDSVHNIERRRIFEPRRHAKHPRIETDSTLLRYSHFRHSLTTTTHSHITGRGANGTLRVLGRHVYTRLAFTQLVDDLIHKLQTIPNFSARLFRCASWSAHIDHTVRLFLDHSPQSPQSVQSLSRLSIKSHDQHFNYGILKVMKCASLLNVACLTAVTLAAVPFYDKRNAGKKT